MAFHTLQCEVDEHGIAVVRFDDTDKPMNVVTPLFIEELSGAIERVASDASIKGAVLTSAKPAFMAGADLKELLSIAGGRISFREAFAFSQRPSQLHRRLEMCGKPIVAALNGLTLGGGYELALACHRRFISDDPAAVVGLPEVTVGLLPGSGGTQRLPRLIGTEHSLDVLLEGKSRTPTEALQIGMVDELVPATELLIRAKNWILCTPDAIRAWDRRDYVSPGGLLNAAIGPSMMLQTARLAARTQYNYPAPIAILDCVFEGLQLPFETALRFESKHFARLLCDPISRNLIRTSFVNKGAAMKLVRRPKNISARKVKALGVLGAGLMGAGVAQVAAAAGIDVILIDRTLEHAEKGKAAAARSLAKAAARRPNAQPGEDAAARIRTSVDYQDLSGCELIVEAVFEDPAIKGEVTHRAEAALSPNAIIASNTSTLPITELARATRFPSRFIGLHFFSPVDRMALVEVIVGEQTNDTTLAHALDFVAQLRKVPILVRDARGFYTSRVFQTFIHEGMRMLEDGVQPALIENAARLAGFPVGPLALVDEVTVDLPWKIVQEASTALGDRFERPCAYQVMSRMIELDRRGKRYGRGFYEYPDNAPKRLWYGLAQIFPVAPAQPSIDFLKKRLLYIQSLETARCLEEGVLLHAADADLGSILGWGFPSWTGGTLSLIDTVGIEAFVADCQDLSQRYGKRFEPSLWLLEKAQRHETFLSA